MTPNELVNQNIELVSMPEVCITVQSMADDITCSTEAMGKVVGQDTALTAKVLKLVNSPFYGLRVPVDTISRAINIIGAQALRSLALASSAVETFSGISSDLVDMVTFWRHSVFCGLLARRIATRCNILHPERLFIAGILHDVGQLLIYAKMPDQAEDILVHSKDHNGYNCNYEFDVLGFDHAEVGAKLMALWNMPESLQEAIGCHHAPERAEIAQVEAGIIYLADTITYFIEQIDAENPAPFYDPYGTFLKKRDANIDCGLLVQNADTRKIMDALGISDEDIANIVEEASEGFGEVLNLFYPIGQMLE